MPATGPMSLSSKVPGKASAMRTHLLIALAIKITTTLALWHLGKLVARNGSTLMIVMTTWNALLTYVAMMESWVTVTGMTVSQKVAAGQ